MYLLEVNEQYIPQKYAFVLILTKPMILILKSLIFNLY